ncbi:hypothetical protein NC651_013109 [Populus alba x Populus x berolinensis]|nr:hypothetical protein NC651_013109 [Populus alba x Populus x berolinensis]
MAAGIPHKDSPQMRPDATAGPKSLAFCLLLNSKRKRIKLPTHMSMQSSHQDRTELPGTLG